MSLPEWVNDDMAWEYSAEEQLKKTLEALSIAVEFIERMAKGNRYPRTLQDAKDTLKRISDLGGKRA